MLFFVDNFLKSSLVCNRDCRGHKTIVLNKILAHVSVYTRLHGEVFARVHTEENPLSSAQVCHVSHMFAVTPVVLN